MKNNAGVISFCILVLLSIGLMFLYSATFADIQDGGKKKIIEQEFSSEDVVFDESRVEGAAVFKKQISFAILGLICCAVVAFGVDYKKLNNSWTVGILWVASAALLIMVFFPALGGAGARNHATRWISVSFLTFQPSELAKIAVVVFFAWYGARKPKKMGHFWKGIVVPYLAICPILFLVVKEPDVGTFLLLIAVAAVMLLSMGAKWYYIVLPGGILGVLGSLYIYKFDTMRWNRIVSWLDVEGTKQDVGFQLYRAYLAFCNGGYFGVGFGEGQMKNGFIPERHTDFILPVIAEEMGVIFCVLILVVFVILMIYGFRTALHAKDNFGSYLALGITYLIILQCVINVGVVTGCFPNKGMPLPFISKGGSNLLLLFCSMGLLLSVARRGHKESMPSCTDLNDRETFGENLGFGEILKKQGSEKKKSVFSVPSNDQEYECRN